MSFISHDSVYVPFITFALEIFESISSDEVRSHGRYMILQNEEINTLCESICPMTFVNQNWRETNGHCGDKILYKSILSYVSIGTG